MGKAKLWNTVNQLVRKGAKYDSLVALIGGRDSTYALHYSVKVLGLKPLAFTVDNGLLHDTTHENILNATKALNVDHIFVKHDYLRRFLPLTLKAWLNKPSAPMVTFLCLGCRIGMRKAFLEVKGKYNLQLCISGAGEPEKLFAKAFFTQNTKPFQSMFSMMLMIGIEILKNPEYLVQLQIPYNMVMEFLYEYPPIGIVHRFVRPDWRYIELFRYLPYNEQKIMNTIQRDLKWKKWEQSTSAWRSDCKVNLLKNKFYLDTVGFSKNDEMISNLIRMGQISRE